MAVETINPGKREDRKGEKERMEREKGKVKRYNLVLPSGLFDEVQGLADSENVSVLELLKRFIKIGLILTKFSQSPDTSLILREGDKERELILV